MTADPQRNANMPANANIRLIVGLGNVGAKYDHTRHNMGYDLLELIARRYNISLNPESKFAGLHGKGSIEGHEVHLLFPTTYMNESGRAVGPLCKFFKIAPEEILVLHDELDLAPGQMKLKFGGGLAGHNGLKSITAHLANSQDYYRLRIGIGKGPDTYSWVLGKPSPVDRALIEETLDAAAVDIGLIYTQGITRATSAINGFKPLAWQK
ncbi:aminoacyl-tRNA hydrolase [Anaerobiospirillum sp. NML120449]|uniref:aminoacyl-tRNA hydrolase n=2 Tax=Anaerobiospirillum TaxID=13334 RepID=UPI001FF640A6|nr:aminoacyl-tRNA hydrolase [Anaerobiospirillum sp. NML120449]MCK0526731.1 aminoacyl-tRNA hydrolase [Anaerobiospirillum sp. NML120449]